MPVGLGLTSSPTPYVIETLVVQVKQGVPLPVDLTSLTTPIDPINAISIVNRSSSGAMRVKFTMSALNLASNPGSLVVLVLPGADFKANFVGSDPITKMDFDIVDLPTAATPGVTSAQTLSPMAASNTVHRAIVTLLGDGG